MPNTTKGFPYPEGTALPDVPGDIQNLAQSIDTYLNNYAPLLSPTLSGIPAAPTANAGTNTTQIATTAFVQTAVTGFEAIPSKTGNNGKYLTTDGSSLSWAAIDVSSYAPLASPTFTGIPLAPTATAGTNTTQVATTEFVRTEVSNLISAAPAALDTLDELAAALGDDANFASTVTTSLSGKAPLSSPTFTGTPLAPTAGNGTNTTQIATTAFVQDAISTKANLASPTFTGTPLAPTAAGGTNTTQIATTAYVQTEVSSKANSASPTFTGTITADSLTVTGTAIFQEVIEDVVDVAHSSNALTLDYTSGNVFFMATAFSASATINITNAPTTDGRVFSVTLFATQGATGYNPTAININGTAGTIRWAGGITPTPTSTAGKIDIYTFTLIRRGGSWTVLSSAVTNF